MVDAPVDGDASAALAHAKDHDGLHARPTAQVDLLGARPGCIDHGVVRADRDDSVPDDANRLGRRPDTGEPAAVIADLDTLTTVGAEEIAAGMAEVIKTGFIADPEILAKVDAQLAEAATRWGSLSDEKLTDAIDATIEKHDPDAVRLVQPTAVAFGG